MPGAASSEVSHAGQRLRRRVLLALALSGVLPLAVLVYVSHVYVLPTANRVGSEQLLALQVLLFFTLLAMVAGGYIIWDLGRTVAQIGRMLADEARMSNLEHRRDEVGTLMQSFSKMLETIEQQAAEINSFAARLDAAYKELESTNARLQETSFKDEVTGLYNRRFFSIRLDEEMQRHRRFNHPVSIVLLDLDGFKAINDELGHAVGDGTLRDVAQILMKQSRGINVVARYGGDEFAILLVETSLAGARLYADRIRQVISTYAFSHGKPLTASFGVASLPDESITTSEDLIRAADDALYAAKRAGKNQVVGTAAPETLS